MVANKHSFWYGSIMKFPRISMCWYQYVRNSISNRHQSISTSICSFCFPQPTCISFLYRIPEKFFCWCSSVMLRFCPTFNAAMLSSTIVYLRHRGIKFFSTRLANTHLSSVKSNATFNAAIMCLRMSIPPFVRHKQFPAIITRYFRRCDTISIRHDLKSFLSNLFRGGMNHHNSYSPTYIIPYFNFNCLILEGV